LLVLYLSFVQCSVFYHRELDHVQAINNSDYEYYCSGRCKSPVRTTTELGLVLMGGGLDVDDAFIWMGDKSGHGDFLVIRTDGTDAYDDYIYGLGHCNSASTLIIKTTKGSNDPFVIATIKEAEAIFVAGGDQSTYYYMWSNTGVQQAVNEHISKGAPFGGTSAGCAVMGEVIFSAKYGTVYSDDALENPYDKQIVLELAMFKHPFLQNIITDTHFEERDRMGRLLTFLARIIEDQIVSNNSFYGIGISQNTAILIDQHGNATISGSESAYFIHGGPPTVCEPQKPLEYENVPVYRMDQGTVYYFNVMKGVGGISYFLSAADGNLTSSNGSIY